LGLRAFKKIKYVHRNPAEAGLFYFSEDYVHSSAPDYAGRKRYLDDIVVFEYFDWNE
jgi:hypothetical protein